MSVLFSFFFSFIDVAPVTNTNLNIKLELFDGSISSFIINPTDDEDQLNITFSGQVFLFVRYDEQPVVNFNVQPTNYPLIYVEVPLESAVYDHVLEGIDLELDIPMNISAGFNRVYITVAVAGAFTPNGSMYGNPEFEFLLETTLSGE